MIKTSLCLLLICVCALGMQQDGDEMMVKICALQDEDEHPITILPASIALCCQTLIQSIEFKCACSELSKDYDNYPFYVAPEYASPALWEKLKPCLMHIDNVQKLSNAHQLGEVLLAANYLGHAPLFDACVAQWAERDYPAHPEVPLPQEMECRIAHAMLVKHKLINKLIHCAVEKTPVSMKSFACKGARDVWTCALGSTGNVVVAGRMDGSIHYWTKKKNGWRRRAIAHAHEGEHIGRVQCIDSDRKFISSAAGKGFKIWDIASGACLKSVGDVLCDGFYCAYDEARQLLAISTKEYDINVYDMSGDEPSLWLELDGHNDRIYALDFNKKGDQLVSASNDKAVTIWNLQTGEDMCDFEIPDSPLSVQFSNNGNFLAVGSEKGTVQLFDVKKFCLAGQQVKVHDDKIWGCAFNPDDSVLITGAVDRKIKIWSAPDLECLRVIDGDLGQILFMDAHFDRNQILVGFSNGNLGMINIQALMSQIAEQRSILKHGMNIDRVQFLVAASRATKQHPLVCTEQYAKIFNSFGRNARAQLLKHFAIKAPDDLPESPQKGKKNRQKRVSAGSK